MHSIPSKRIREEFTHIMDDVAFCGERYVVTRNGRELVAVISMSDLKELQALENKRDIEAAQKAERYSKKHGTVPWNEVEKLLGIDGE